MRLLRQNTAVVIHVGPAVATDGLKAVTTLKASTVTAIKIIKHGSLASVAPTSVTGRTFAHKADGHYSLSLLSGDANTLGHFTAYIRASGTVKALPIWERYLVVPANVFDSLVSATTLRRVDVRQWVGTTVTGPTATGRVKVDLRTWVGNAPAALTATGWVQARTKANDDKTGYLLSSGSVVWSAAARTLTSAAVAWTAAGRVLSSGGAVWAATPRTLTSGLSAACSVWAKSLSEATGVPAAAPPAGKGLVFLYMSARNKRITTATGDKVHNSATSVIGTAAVSFVTGTQTFTKQKYA